MYIYPELVNTIFFPFMYRLILINVYSICSSSSSVAPSPTGSGRVVGSEVTNQSDGAAAALQRALASENIVEKERRLTEMIVQLQYLRDQLLQQQQDPSKVHILSISFFRCTLVICEYDTIILLLSQE